MGTMDDILPRVAKKPRTWSKNSVRQEVDRYFTAAPWSEEEERKAAEEEAARKAAEDEAARKADEEEAEAARRAAEEEASERCLALVKLVKDNEMLSEIEVASVVVEATSKSPKRLTKSTATSPTSLSSTFIAHTMDPATSFKLRQTLVALKIRVSWNNTFQSLIP